MKQAKYALTAIAVLAVIGGALAFKARIGTNVFYTEKDGACIQSTTLPYQTAASGFTVKLSTGRTLSPCPTITVQQLP
ncbi:hypothetical protein [Chitinophaga eiseniae]|uniref:Uncharacterized protein n=1 Tax=Chitinophaga eiseniae TaxID=634771 RepID=A0A847SML2_9BACT|nr:hypothetical protein [Chitinophaga eiseniae]NLR81424.1 hypothetical protein [Chitinophaga eiseniae]